MPKQPPKQWSVEEITEALARSRGQLPEGVEITPELLGELEAQVRADADAARFQRREDLLAGDVEIDPALLDQGDEVAEEVVADFKKVASRKFLDSGSRKPVATRFSQDEQRRYAQEAQDLMLEFNISQAEATARVARQLRVPAKHVVAWGVRWGIDLGSANDPRNSPRAMQWDIRKREDLFNRQLYAISLLTDRAIVWIQGTGEEPPPYGWNAAMELKTLVIASAILHDKATAVEDLKIARGLRDLDSEELQSELRAGRERIALMEQNPE